ncbi:MAG: hypothetical protein M1817_003553 [Caeruleum heppii]|nr:MAG: hypothetical protein M1817_003553 [Caeruleum heppii]
MAARDYYNPSPSYQLPPIDFDAPPAPPPSSSKPANIRKTSDPTDRFNARPLSGSPFDSHIHPLHRQDSPHGYDESPYYYGGGNGATSPDRNPFADDIPLRDHPGKPSIGGSTIQTDRRPSEVEKGSPIEDGHRSRRKRGSKLFKGKGRTPWFIYIITLIQVTVFIGELVKNSVLTKSPIMIKPQFNYMIGPSNYVMINMGARWVPCMRTIEGVQNADKAINWPCPNSVSSDRDSPEMACTLSQLCGFSGVPNPRIGGSLDEQPQPNQWFRFIVPMFLHAGVIHLSFNMLLQLTLGRDMEKIVGPFRLALVYFSSGIFGFVLGGNFAAPFKYSVGASGCLFGVIALILLDLLYTWKERRSPYWDLGFIILDIVISFVLGLLPGLDNFAHIGGFLMGLVLGVCILHSPTALRQKIGEDVPPYAPVESATSPTSPKKIHNTTMKHFVKQPVGFFKERKPLWWGWWLLRAGALIAVLVGFIVLLNNFYKYRHQCRWCKYLSCLDIKDWCDAGNLDLMVIDNTGKTSRREL